MEKDRRDELDTEKANVRQFYDQVGWRQEGGRFVDTLLFDDVRPVSEDYRRKCNLRIKKYLNPSGRYFLDLGSGPVPYDEYVEIADRYHRRICIDFSVVALVEARKRLGDKGLYILGDITRLPLKNETVDAAIALHSIYHIPADQQSTAFAEMYRVLKPASSGVVVYSGRYSFLVRLPFKIIQTIITLLRSVRASPNPAQPDLSPLYFHTHSYKWIAKELRNGYQFTLASWSSINVPFLHLCVHRWLLGKQFLALIYFLEDRFPYLLGRMGQYPMFILKK